MERLKQLLSGRGRGTQRRGPRGSQRRRQDPDWSTLPGGGSPKEAASVPEDRAREIAD